MKGVVVLVNARNGMFVVEVGQGSRDYTVIELIDCCDVVVGDEVTGNLHSEDCPAITNITQGYAMAIYIQGVHCSASTARAICFP